MVLHIVLYEPKAGLSDSDISEFRSALTVASTSIPQISQVRVGRAVNLGIGYEHRSSGQSFSYMAIFEFSSSDDLMAYMAHPAHAALAGHFWKYCERTMILDVEAEDPRGGGPEGLALPVGPDQKK